MIQHDEVLQELQEKVARRRKLSGMMEDLNAQRRQLLPQLEQLDRIRIKEQQDVDKLEGRSLAAFFYNIIGKLDEQADKERAEAYAAAVKYDAAARELENIKADLERYSAEYNALSGVEGQYVHAMENKAQALKESGSPVGQEILQLETGLGILRSRQKEIREAIFAGEFARNAAGDALDVLGSAGNLATWDMLGGGLLVDMAKHEKLNEAQHHVDELQERLRRFRTELADVSMRSDLHVNLDGFTRFADYFFDGLFMDWAVSSQISQSKTQVEEIKAELDRAVDRLKGLESSTDHAIREDQTRLDKLVLETKL